MIRLMYRNGRPVQNPATMPLEIDAIASAEGATQSAVEDGICNRIDLELVLARLSPLERDIVRLHYRYRIPEDYTGDPDPTHADIARYITQRHHIGGRRGRSVQTVRRILARLAGQWALEAAAIPSDTNMDRRLAAWEPVIRQLAHRLANGNAAMVDDLAQEGRIAAWQCAIPSGCRSPAAYLRTVITHRMIDVARAERATHRWSHASIGDAVQTETPLEQTATQSATAAHPDRLAA